METNHLERMHGHNQNIAAFNKEKRIEQSKEQLFIQIKKKLETSFIGALSHMENNFGPLWGHGLAEQELTDEQREFRQAWDMCRSAILDNGNNQIRALQNELKQYTVHWERYKLNLPVKPIG